MTSLNMKLNTAKGKVTYPSDVVSVSTWPLIAPKPQSGYNCTRADTPDFCKRIFPPLLVENPPALLNVNWEDQGAIGFQSLLEQGQLEEANLICPSPLKASLHCNSLIVFCLHARRFRLGSFCSWMGRCTCASCTWWHWARHSSVCWWYQVTLHSRVTEVLNVVNPL